MSSELVFLKKDRTSKEERPLTSSLLVAEYFEKDHFHVTRDIEKLDCSEEFRASNFGCTSYTDKQGKKQKVYNMTKDGFTFLVMGYKGKKAAKFKEAYIKEFNHKQTLLDEKNTPEYQQLMFYDIPHQKEQMKKLDSGIKDKNPIKYIKANTIADKAVSLKFGYKKAIKKEDMTTEMIKEREKILEQITTLMLAQSLGVDIPHISEVIYKMIGV